MMGSELNYLNSFILSSKIIHNKVLRIKGFRVFTLYVTKYWKIKLHTAKHVSQISSFFFFSFLSM